MSASASSVLPDGFVYLSDIDSSILQSVRYAGSNNFIGKPIAGYEAEKIILTEVSARALSAVQRTLLETSGNILSLVVFDGYRPQTAVDHFIAWSEDFSDVKMKDEYYPNIPDKSQLFELGYIAKRSSHSRGSTVDLSIALVDPSSASNTGSSNEKIDYMPMGSEFDVLDPISHFHCDKIDGSCRANRKLLRDLMVEHGFEPYDEEWWHFSFINEPFPDTYHSFPVH